MLREKNAIGLNMFLLCGMFVVFHLLSMCALFV